VQKPPHPLRATTRCSADVAGWRSGVTFDFARTPRT